MTKEYKDKNKDKIKAYNKMYREKRKNRVQNITHKKCNTCNENKTLNEFSKNASGRFGRHNECKKCRHIKRTKLNYTRITNTTKICSICGDEQNVDEFHADKYAKDGLQSECKTCRKKISYKWESSLNGNISVLYKDLVHNAKKKRTKNINVNITKQDILNLYNKQNRRCALSGYKMTHTGRLRKKQKCRIMNYYNISVDRIDSNKGYVVDNIQLVCAFINRAKMDLPDSDFIKLCHDISKYQKEKRDQQILQLKPIADKNNVIII